jgi:hypothetical protein
VPGNAFEAAVAAVAAVVGAGRRPFAAARAAGPFGLAAAPFPFAAPRGVENPAGKAPAGGGVEHGRSGAYAFFAPGTFPSQLSGCFTTVSQVSFCRIASWARLPPSIREPWGLRHTAQKNHTIDAVSLVFDKGPRRTHCKKLCVPWELLDVPSYQ